MRAMRTKDSVALQVAPLLIRLMLGVTFLWAGLGKYFADFPATPEQVTVLQSMGALPGGPPTQPPPDPDLTPDPDASGDSGSPDGGISGVTPPDLTAPFSGNPEVHLIPVAWQDSTEVRDETRVRGLFRIALAIHNAANPPPVVEGEESRGRYWPAALAQGPRPVWQAWSVTVVEIVTGFFLLTGFMTRLSAVALAGVMGGAVWLTQIGPAIATGSTQLGFLPAYPTFDVAAWQPLMWQFALLMSSLALVFTGCGGLGVDGVLFGSKPMNEGGADD